MSKLQQLKKAIKNPPPERVAQIEYKSHLYQAFGVTFVCLVLIWKGYWWVVFAFIFGLGVSYSQGMTAYMRYKNIISILGKEDPMDYQKDISPTRKRSKIVKYYFGDWVGWGIGLISVLAALLAVDPTQSRWMLMLQYPIIIFLVYVFLYFFLFYWVANYFYRSELELKGGVYNGKKKERRS